MKTVEIYEAPRVDIYHVEVEQGFAVSEDMNGMSTESMEEQNGTW